MRNMEGVFVDKETYLERTYRIIAEGFKKTYSAVFQEYCQYTRNRSSPHIGKRI